MTLTLFHNPQSRAVIIHLLLEEIGVPFELKRVNYDDGSLRTPEFLALNPMGKIPTLVDGDTVVTECAAIAIYLADKYKSPHDLAPGIDDPRRGEYLRWIIFQSTCVEAAMTQASVKFELERQRAGWGSVELVVDVLKKRLAKANPYLFGDWYTAADVLLGATIGWALEFGMFPNDSEFTDYAGRIRERPAAQRALGSAEQS